MSRQRLPPCDAICDALHPAQFGFASDRGRNMVIAFAHDVSEHFSRPGTPEFTCSIDAHGTLGKVKIKNKVLENVYSFEYLGSRQ